MEEEAKEEPGTGAATEGLIESADAPAAGYEDTGGLDVGLFVLMAVIVLLVCVQNVWLRRRAERENAAESGEPAPETREPGGS